MAEFQRKIELQSLDDLQYLVTNMRRAAHAKLDLDLPPVAGDDPMRARVEPIVAQYIHDVIETAAPNIAINGLDLSPALLAVVLSADATAVADIEEYEPFDGRLLERAKDLARLEEDLIEEIAALRRTVPAKIVDSAKAGYQNEIERDETMIRELEERIEKTDRGTADLGIEALERQEDVERNWERGVTGLGALMRCMPEMIAKKERAEKAEAYVLNEDIKHKMP